MMEQTSIKAVPSTTQARGHWARRAPALILFALFSFLYLKRQIFKAPKQVDVSALKLVTIDGDLLPITQLRGKAVVLNFWAPWCGPCRVETPWLGKLQRSHPNDLVVVGVVADAGQYPEATAFMKKQGVSYPIVRDTAEVDAVFGNVAGLPTTFYIAPEGRVVHTASGLIPEFLMQHYASDAIGSN
ncbi:MAG: TlpA disulfide reductase family protein [Terriglobales bacterium]